MIRTILAPILALALTAPALAKPRHKPRPVCVSFPVEGVGTGRFCSGR